MIRALSHIQVDFCTSLKAIVHLMTANRATNVVFSEIDLPTAEASHIRALYIIFVFVIYSVSLVLVDNGSILDVCLLAPTVTLGYGLCDYHPSLQTAHEYNGSHRGVVEILTLDVLITPIIFPITFQVLDIPASFNLILGHPHIHSMGAIPSLLHLKVRFNHDSQVITVSAIDRAHLLPKPVLEISPTKYEPLLLGFEFLEIHSIELFNGLDVDYFLIEEDIITNLVVYAMMEV